jgi:hypothetical protein
VEITRPSFEVALDVFENFGSLKEPTIRFARHHHPKG